MWLTIAATLVMFYFGNVFYSSLRQETLSSRLQAKCASRGRLRWYGYVERKETKHWISPFGELRIEGIKGKGGGRKTWNECVKADKKRSLTTEKRPTLPQCGNEGVVLYGLHSHHI